MVIRCFLLHTRSTILIFSLYQLSYIRVLSRANLDIYSDLMYTSTEFIHFRIVQNLELSVTYVREMLGVNSRTSLEIDN